MAIEARLSAMNAAAAAIAEARIETRAVSRRIDEEAKAVEELQGLASAERTELEGIAELLSRERDSLTEMAQQLQVGPKGVLRCRYGMLCMYVPSGCMLSRRR